MVCMLRDPQAQRVSTLPEAFRSIPSSSHTEWIYNRSGSTTGKTLSLAVLALKFLPHVLVEFVIPILITAPSAIALWLSLLSPKYTFAFIVPRFQIIAEASLEFL